MKFKGIIIYQLIVLLSFIFMVNVDTLYAQSPTIDEIIHTVSDNMSVVQDIKAKFISNRTNKVTPDKANENGLYWMKMPDKVKLLYLSDGRSEIFNGNMIYMIDKSTESLSLSTFNVSYHQLDYISNADVFLQENTLTLLDSEVNNNDLLYTIEVIPHKENLLYSKLIMTIHYESGLVIDSKLYGFDGQIASSEEILFFQKNIVDGKEVNIISKQKNTIHFPDEIIVNVIEYKDIEINTGIDDSIFEVKQ